MVREECVRACPAGGAGVPTPFKVWAQARFGHGVPWLLCLGLKKPMRYARTAARGDARPPKNS